MTPRAKDVTSEQVAEAAFEQPAALVEQSRADRPRPPPAATRDRAGLAVLDPKTGLAIDGRSAENGLGQPR